MGVNMIFEISSFELQQMLTTAAELGARKVISSLNLDKKQIRQFEANEIYGEKRIAEWRKNGDIKPIKQGRCIYYDKAKLEQLSTINRLNYTHNESIRARQKADK